VKKQSLDHILGFMIESDKLENIGRTGWAFQEYTTF